MYQIPNIETERLVLRKYTMDDFNDYYEWRSQKDAHTYVSTNVKSQEDCRASLKNTIECYDKEVGQNLVWGVALKSSNKIIGSVNISTISRRNRICEVGWSISPTYQKQGYAFEASKALLKYIFEVLDINKVTTVIWHKNEPSLKLATKLGFVREGVQREMRWKEGEVYDLVMLGLLKREWTQK